MLKWVYVEIKLNNISQRQKATIFETNESNIFMDDYIICLNMNYLSTIFKATAQKGLRKNELEWYITEKKDAKETDKNGY